MRWEDMRPSDNVEVDCLGLRANLTGPAGQAALACQHEVDSLRGSFVSGQGIAGLINGSDDRYRSLVEDFTTRSMKEDDKLPNSLWTFLYQLYAGKDGRDKNGLVVDPKLYRNRLDALKAEISKPSAERAK